VILAAHTNVIGGSGIELDQIEHRDPGKNVVTQADGNGLSDDPDDMPVDIATHRPLSYPAWRGVCGGAGVCGYVSHSYGRGSLLFYENRYGTCPQTPAYPHPRRGQSAEPPRS